MGYSIMIDLKEPFVCIGFCNHKSCKSIKNFVINAVCIKCNKQVLPKMAYYKEKDGLIHFACMFTKQDKRQKRKLFHRGKLIHTMKKEIDINER